MADADDPGIDKQKILAEIGASAPLPGTQGTAAPSGAQAPAPGSSAPAPIPARPSSPGRWVRHRGQIAAIVMAFVSLMWMSVGLATHERAPFAFGGGFLGLAVAAAAGSLLRER